uniref:Uncharacterized protein n=1 Tax=Candidatus Kentrum sp. MB TaxID=2138164 RepID=A0A450Y060_9GAMM|nr:MAG: Protein of unknown function (DUF4435) [Candidatus Kentron sp. MB]VFK34924.1 MAG: Protein of unknown function (DUF4435) [Candidatus Kentron sp. MB]VFK77041.1 MAG: Protein of unknown function (DUF4435) [Candidatus Kentron sp. MB]
MNVNGFIDENRIVKSIQRKLRHPSGSNKIWIIVEGETDRKLFYKFINSDRVEVEISHGGLNGVLKIVAELSRETDCILGIRDADFLHLEGETETPKNIFLTDHHDAEMMIISCDEVYRNLAIEYSVGKHDDSKGMDSVHSGSFDDPLSSRERILDSIAFICALKWINHTDDLGLNFDGLGLGDFYHWNNQESFPILEENKYLDVILKRSENKKRKVSREEIHLKIKDIQERLDLCNGHDFMKAFSLSTKRGSQKGIDDKTIAKAFRAAYRFMDFQTTNLYRKLKEWSDNQSFSLFVQA